MTTTAPAIDWEARRAAREAELLATFDPTVPGLPGDGSGLVLHTDPARGLTFTWYDVSRRPQDFSLRERGYLISRLAVTHTSGHEVGYLNVAHTTKELIASQFATPFEWADENTSAVFGFGWARAEGREVTPESIWATAYTHLRQRPPSVAGKRVWTLSASDAPTDPAVLAAELAVVEKEYARQMRGMIRWLSVPSVDYAHVDDADDADRKGTGHPGSLRGTGLGRTMYLLAAQHLARHGKVLRGSGLQSPEAERLWARLVADRAVPTRKTRLTFYKPTETPTHTYWCLDYARQPVTP